MRAEADKYYDEASYALAYEIYKSIDMSSLPEGEARWLKVRTADSLWRSMAASSTSDQSLYEPALKPLTEIYSDKIRDEAWAQACESLADFWWLRGDLRDWSAGYQYYLQALDYWAGSRQMELARSRYIAILRKMAEPSWRDNYYYYGLYGNWIDVQLIRNYQKIAVDARDRAHASYLLALTLQNSQHSDRDEIVAAYEAVLSYGKATEWYDDALYRYALWQESHGKMVLLDTGEYRAGPNYKRALELYDRFLQEFKEGESRFYDEVVRHRQDIVEPKLEVFVTSVFLPDSEIEYILSWRNVEQIELSLYKVDLLEDLNLNKEGVHSVYLFVKGISITANRKVRSWTKTVGGPQEEHLPGTEVLRLGDKLSPGAYIIEAVSGKQQARELILVSDLSIVVKQSKKQILAYVCDALTGAPIPAAQVKVWQQSQYYDYDSGRYKSKYYTAVTGSDGLAFIDLAVENSSFLALAALGDRQAFVNSSVYAYSYYQDKRDDWRVYAFTDRPAYRPNETVKWKFTARVYDGASYTIPVGAELMAEFYDPQGSKIAEQKVKLNSFGSAWGELNLTDAMPLGQYRLELVALSLKDGQSARKKLGSARLFRLEEYKLPEFKLSVQTPEENGRKKAFRLGEKVGVVIKAEYYFGGPVTDADVEVIVYQRPFYHYWRPEKEYHWYYELSMPDYDYGQRTVIKREKLKTDAEGRATLLIETQSSAQGYEYGIEARVVDTSRREIVGTASLRIGNQRYFVYLSPKRYVYKPREKALLEVKALDANDQPVEVEGKVRITREYWHEVWVDSFGKEYTHEQLARTDQPSLLPGRLALQPEFRGYKQEEILQTTVKTDKDGNAEVFFIPDREGYYRVSWISPDKNAPPIKAETVLWVVTTKTNDIGYKQDSVEVIVDKDTFKVGQTARVMLVAPTNGRYVLFSVEGERIYQARVVEMTGQVKLLELELDEKYVPNVYLTGSMVFGTQHYTDTKQVVVPPTENFLTVEVATDKQTYLPRESGTLTITTKDDKGQPVSAEVALGIVDEAVFYIQGDYAGDPRKYFYGQKRSHGVQTHTSFDSRPYVKLLPVSVEVAKSKGEYKEAPSDLGVLGEAKPVAEAVPAPPVPPAEPQPGRGDVSSKEMQLMNGELDAGQGTAKIIVRSDFSATVFWQPDIVTDEQGKAEVKFTYPDSLTTWHATARAVAANRFGIAETSSRTTQPLIARLQAPRFFLVEDEVTVSGVINNNTDKPLQVQASLFVEGLEVVGAVRVDGTVVAEDPTVSVPANGTERVDWLVGVKSPGKARLQLVVKTSDYADAVEKEYVVYERGIEKYIAKSGKVRGSEVTFSIDIPAQRKRETTSLTLQVTPSLAVTILDALPYLIDYPYGCTEQTISRFLPAVITAKTLRDLGLKPEDAMHRVLGAVEQSYAAKTHPQAEKDLRKLEKMVREGLARLYDFQHADGGWGWWKEGNSDHFMTAYVVWGLVLARQAGIEVRSDVLERAVNFLNLKLVEEETNYDLQAWLLHALAKHNLYTGGVISKQQQRAFDNLWQHRNRLTAYSLALFALSAHYYNEAEEARVLLRNLENGVYRDDRPDASILVEGKASDRSVIATAHWGKTGFYWRWTDSAVESTAFALQALLAIDPKHQLVEPVVNWLVKNRRGASWSNTRDTAIAVLALNEYLARSGEQLSDVEYDIFVNGEQIASQKVTNITAASIFEVPDKLIRDGSNQISIRCKDGDSNIYFAAQAKYFSLEKPITAVGNEIFVKREYYRLVGYPTLLKGYVYDRVLMKDGDPVQSGDRVEVVITIDAKNDYEYLVVEDLKPAGFEAVEVRSGQPLYAMQVPSLATASGDGVDGSAGRSSYVCQELRDRKVALFIARLTEGLWQIRYTLRAEVPGKFQALPVLGHAMYVPEIRCNSDELYFEVH